MFFSRLRIVGRKEKIGDPDGVNAVLYVDEATDDAVGAGMQRLLERLRERAAR